MWIEWQGLDEYVAAVVATGENLLLLWERDAREAARLLAGRIAQGTPTASGRLVQGLQVKAIFDHRSVMVAVDFQEAYWQYVEYGTGPHWPPAEPIEAWVRVKGIAHDEATVRQLAFLIARKISQQGTKAHHMVKNALDATLPEIDQMFMRSWDKVVRDYYYT